MLDNLSRRERIILVIFFITIIVALYYYFLYQPLVIEISETRKKVESSELQIQEYIIKISKKADLEKKYSYLNNFVEDYKEKSIKSVNEMLQVLQEQASNSGIMITSFIPVSKDGHTEVRMTAEGSYQELVTFFNGLKILTGPIEYQLLRITNNQRADGTLTINATFVYDSDIISGGEKS